VEVPPRAAAGALQGATPREAYFVKCDAGTMTDSDVFRGVVKLVMGLAPLKPAEFVILEIQQRAGQSADEDELPSEGSPQDR
jgi:phage tail sheath protein FI